MFRPKAALRSHDLTDRRRHMRARRDALQQKFSARLYRRLERRASARRDPSSTDRAVDTFRARLPYAQAILHPVSGLRPMFGGRRGIFTPVVRAEMLGAQRRQSIDGRQRRRMRAQDLTQDSHESRSRSVDRRRRSAALPARRPAIR